MPPKYFVPPSKPKEKAIRSLSDADSGGAKYFTPLARVYPKKKEFPELWDGRGPDLPKGYEGGEACPDCSAFRFSRHAPMCIRNPNQITYDLSKAWGALHTKEQIFFGAGHPNTADVDEYMTQEKQRRLIRAGIVVMYDVPSGKQSREVIASWVNRAGAYLE